MATLNKVKIAIAVAYLISGMAGGYMLFLFTQPKPPSNDAEVRIAKIETERDAYAATLAAVNHKLDSAKLALAERPKQITKIKIKYVEIRDSINSLPVDGRLELFAKRISQGGYRGQ